MAFHDEVGQIKKIKQFDGGVKSQREHINEVVDAVNTIIQAAWLEDFKKGFQDTNQAYIIVDGGAVEYIISMRPA